MVETGAHHLGLAAERVGVLDPFVAGQVRLPDGAARQQAAQQPRHIDLAGLSAQFMDTGVERHVAALGGIDRQGSRHQGRRQTIFRREQSQQGQSGRDLGAVQQGQTFLGLQHQRLKPRRRQPFRRRNGLAADRDFADADQGRRQVGQRGQIARSTDGAFGRDHRQDAMIGESQQRLDHDRTNAGVAARQTGGLEGEDQAYRGRCERRPCACGVGEHQPGLEFPQALIRDALPGEQAEPRVDAIGRVAARDDPGDRRRRGFDRRFPAGIKGQVQVGGAGDAAQVRQCQPGGLDCQGLEHESVLPQDAVLTGCVLTGAPNRKGQAPRRRTARSNAIRNCTAE